MNGVSRLWMKQDQAGWVYKTQYPVVCLFGCAPKCFIYRHSVRLTVLVKDHGTKIGTKKTSIT